jgi:hypothetical protein
MYGYAPLVLRKWIIWWWLAGVEAEAALAVAVGLVAFLLVRH